jgi:putative ABC transport system substrate-binding protein
MKRRAFVGLLAGAVATVIRPRASRAQPVKVPRVGFLGLPSADSLPKRTDAFRAGLRELGYHEGQDLIVEYRWANSSYDRLPALLAELIGLKVDVIVTHGTPGVMAAKRATSTIPIVIAVVGDAVASGLVAGLAHPGGNVTGLTFFQPELNAKRLELLKETMPDLTDVGVLLNPSNQMNEPVLPQVAQVAETLKLRLHQFNARNPGEFEAAFAAMADKRVRAFVVFDDAMLIGNAGAIAGLALKHGLCSCGFIDYAAARWSHGLWCRLPRHVPPRGNLCGQDLEGCQAGRLAGRAGDPVFHYSQSRDRQATWTYRTVVAAAPRRRGDRMRRRGPRDSAMTRADYLRSMN